MFRGLCHIQKIIDYLEHQPYGLSKGGEGLECPIVRSSGDAAHSTGCLEQCSGLVAMDHLELFQLGKMFREASERVVHLTDDHIPGTCCQLLYQCGYLLCFKRHLGQLPEGHRQHQITCQNRHRLTGMYMKGGLPSPQRVVVQSWKIVMDKAEAVNQFQSGSSRQGVLCGATSGFTGQDDQHWSDSLSSTECSISGCFSQIVRKQGPLNTVFQILLDHGRWPGNGFHSGMSRL